MDITAATAMAFEKTRDLPNSVAWDDMLLHLRAAGLSKREMHAGRRLAWLLRVQNREKANG